MNKKPYVYLGGDIMSHGSNLVREEEYNKVMDLGINAEIYSPVANKDINDKSLPGLTMEQKIEKNNHLAEEIVKQYCDILWKSNTVVMSPEQNAIGTLVELGILYGWKTFAEYITNAIQKSYNKEDVIEKINDIVKDNINRDIYLHYEDIRDTDIPETKWRRSFSINQFLYGVVLYLEKTGDFEKFDDILKNLKNEYS